MTSHDHHGAPDPRSDEFLGLPLWRITAAEFMDLLGEYRTSPRSGALARRITYLNAHTVNMAFRDADYRRIVQACDVVYADGMGPVLAARWRGVDLPERVNAGDFLPDFACRAAKENWRVAFIGGRPGDDSRSGEAAAAAGKLADGQGNDAPKFSCVYLRDGYFDESAEDDIAAALVDSRAEIVLLGMGSPKQELVMERLAARPELKAITFWCVGALFEYFAGNRLRAPVWMRNCGLEWIVRLVLEPRRMWKRYLVGNTTFLWRTIRGKNAGG